MQFVYKPEGAEPRSWEFNPQRLLSPEVEAIERFTGLEYAEWVEAVGRSSALAIHGLLYVYLKRNNPTLKWDQVQFYMDEVEFQMNDEEKGQLLYHLETKESPLTDAERRVVEQFRDEGIEPKAEAGKA